MLVCVCVCVLQRQRFHVFGFSRFFLSIFFSLFRNPLLFSATYHTSVSIPYRGNFVKQKEHTPAQGLGCWGLPSPKPWALFFWRQKNRGRKTPGLHPWTPNLTVSLNQRRQPMFGECSIIKWPQASSMAMLQGTLPCTTVGPPKGKGGFPFSSPACAEHY